MSVCRKAGLSPALAAGAALLPAQPGALADPAALLQYDEDGMVEAVGRHNPVSFAFEVTSDFMHYRKGVYSK